MVFTILFVLSTVYSCACFFAMPAFAFLKAKGVFGKAFAKAKENQPCIALMHGSVCRKSMFFKKVLVLNPYPQTPFPGKGAILLGLPPLDPVGGYAPATPFLSTIEVFRQSGGISPLSALKLCFIA